MIREESTSDSTLWSDPRTNVGSGCINNDGNLVYNVKNGTKYDPTISVDDFDNDYRPIGKVTSVSVTYGGSGLTDGTYNGRSSNFRDFVLHADGSYAQGNSCSFDFTVSGGVVTSAVPRSNDDGGEGYEIGDVIYCRTLAIFDPAVPNDPLDLNQVPRITVTGVEAAVANEYITTPSTDEDMRFHNGPNWLNYNNTSGTISALNCDGNPPTGVEYGVGINSNDWTWKYSSNSCQDVESTIRSLWGIVTQAVGTTAGGSGNLTGIVRSAATTPDFQVGVADVAFDGNDKTFTMTSGGSTQILPASDNFLIFLNSTLQLKGTTESYTYTGSELTFSEAPLAGMDFYGFYFGKLVLLDEISPFFDNSKQTFTMKLDNEPFSLESDNEDVIPANNLMIFINGVFQEPGVAYSLNGSIIKFSEAPRANSTCSLFIYTGSDADIFVSNTFNSVDPADRIQVASEGSDRLIATVSSASSVDTYEYVGLRPNTATFTAQITNGSVTGVVIDDPGSNYEDPPILLFQGGGGVGASATTTIQTGSGKVLSVNITDSGTGYLSVPTIVPVHPVDLERKSRDRIISNSLALGCTYLTASINSTDTTIQCRNIYYDTTQRYGFPDEGEILIPFYDTTVTPNRWNVERILYGATNTSANTLTVATGGRGYRGTTAAAHTVLTGTYNSTGTACTVTTSSNHNYVTGMRVFLDFTSGPTTGEVNWGPDGEYAVTVTGSTTFTVEFPFSRIASGNVSVLPEVRLRSL